MHTGSKRTSGRVESALKLKQLVQSVDNTGNIDADKFEKLTKSLTEIGGGTLPFKLSFDAISQDGLVTTAQLEQWFVANSTNDKVREWVNTRVAAQFLQAGKIGEQLCDDRVASTLNVETEYRTNANANWCRRLCSTFQRVFCRSRAVLTRHENELGE